MSTTEGPSRDDWETHPQPRPQGGSATVPNTKQAKEARARPRGHGPSPGALSQQGPAQPDS